jgi:2-polyprenyl-6-methoxyphenol hydroxylase-like FAD-dependent oxidoreductase
MAAITLVTLGYDVTVYEARPESDLFSDGILGITPVNTSTMQAMGIKLARFMLDNTFRTWPEKEVSHSTYTYITWTNLHRAITERAEEMGVEFKYGTRYEAGDAPADVTVVASGVGTAKAVSKPHYTGYVVIRGLAYQWAGTPWTTVYGDSASGPWLFNVGDSDDGASVEFFVKRETVQTRTTYSAVAPAEVADLPIRFRRLMETVPIWQTAPLSDWDVPAHMVNFDYGTVIRIGDANGQMRPQTSMGANLGINEAVNIGDMIAGSDTDYVNARRAQFTRGQEIGIQRGKFSK